MMSASSPLVRTSTATDAVDIDAPGQPGLVVSATLALADGSIAPREFRIGAPGAG